MSVVLPEPFRPMSVVTFPGSAQSDTAFRTGVPRNDFPMPSAHTSYRRLDKSDAQGETLECHDEAHVAERVPEVR